MIVLIVFRGCPFCRCKFLPILSAIFVGTLHTAGSTSSPPTLDTVVLTEQKDRLARLRRTPCVAERLAADNTPGFAIAERNISDPGHSNSAC